MPDLDDAVTDNPRADVSGAAVARAVNAHNNAAYQELRFERWTQVRDSAWDLLQQHLPEGGSVLLVGAGNCDDLPLRRLAAVAGRVDLVDFDPGASARAISRVPDEHVDRVQAIELDVTGGGVDELLRALRDDEPLPWMLDLPRGPMGDGPYDLVVGDMLYTQLMHPSLLALGIPLDRHPALMLTYDPQLVTALVQRLQASATPAGTVVHVHDVACWTDTHPQPLTVEQVLDRPEAGWARLERHDQCDPQLVLEQLRTVWSQTAWWHWPFEPAKDFVVRATVTRGSAPFPDAAPGDDDLG